MKLTNVHGYPEPFVRAVSLDGYDRGEADYSVSELILPPRLRQLVKRHDSEIVEDVSERLWVIMGTVAHEILERGGREGQELTEKRLYAVVAGRKISGKPDTLCLTRGRLTDYKVTSAWSYVFGGRPEWEMQLNAYAFLARENGHQVKDAEIFAMFRDWSASKSSQSSDYPKTNCLRIPIALREHQSVRLFLAHRVELHEMASRTGDDFLESCTGEERWTKPVTYAVMKPGRKSAVVTGENREAIEQQARQVPGSYIVERPGRSARCENYCPAAPFCNQWAKDPTNPANISSEVAANA